MDCKIDPELFVDFHFGKISPPERGRVESHLGNCQSCLHEYFSLKRDLEMISDTEKPSELVKLRLRRDFAAYCDSLISVESRQWLYSQRTRLALGFLAIAAALLLIIYSGQAGRTSPEAAKKSQVTDELKSLDEAIDSGRLSPGHINII